LVSSPDDLSDDPLFANQLHLVEAPISLPQDPCFPSREEAPTQITEAADHQNYEHHHFFHFQLCSSCCLSYSY